MKTQKILQTALFLFLLIIFSISCKENLTEPIQTKADLLTGTSWQIQKVLDVSSNPGQKIDISSQFPYISQTFSKDGTYTTPVHNGTWELIDNETKILFDKGTISETIADILELTSTIFRMSMKGLTSTASSTWEITFVPAPLSVLKDKSPENNFDALWRAFDERYSFFIIKNINWDSLYSVYRPSVTNKTTDLQLFQIASSLLSHLKDGHVSLSTPYGTYAYTGWYSRYPTNFLGMQVVTSYLSTDYGTTASGYMRFGKITDIGYIYVGPNLMGDPTEWSKGIDRVIDSLKEMRGIIVDIRNNGGGSDILGDVVASRFADKQRIYSYTKVRNGPKHTDFTDYISHSISPQGLRQFTKPVAFLTNRHCFSSAEGTTLMFRALPNVTIIGDTTGGGSANPITLQLPNGWTYRVSRWIQYTADKEVFEGKGLQPDIPVRITNADESANRDAILEKAIQFLHNK